MDTSDRAMLSKDSWRVCVEVNVWDDSIAEREEIFQCVLSPNEDFYVSNFNLDTPIATVVLEDDDGTYAVVH